jgi:RimJ/RimL family protein N-acetyltransferase
LLGFGFSLRLRHTATMWATADPENLASVRVLEKSGLTSRGLTDPVETWRGLRQRVQFEIEAEQRETHADRQEL